MAKSREEIILPVDWDLIDATNGLNFDMGGSVMKLVYVDKNDWIEPSKREKGSKGKLRLVNFARHELSEAYEFINSRVKFNRKDPSDIVDIYSTGYGSSQFQDDFKTKCNVRNNTLEEGDCYKHGFLHLVKNYPRKDILHSVYKPAFEMMKTEIETNIKVFGETGVGGDILSIQKTISDFTFPQLEAENMDKPFSDDKDFFPCGIMVCGSAFGMITVDADASVKVCDQTSFAGKTFMGLGSLLTNAKDYNELMDLCAKGDVTKVSLTNKGAMEQLQSGSGDDTYAAWAKKQHEQKDTPDPVLFAFAKADNKAISDFKREDLARSLLQTMCHNLATVTYANATKAGIKHLFFLGGFVNHPLVREILTYEWLRKDYTWTIFTDKAHVPTQAHFLVQSQSIGAIGAMLNHKQQWRKPPKKASGEAKSSEKDYKSGTGL